MNIYQYHSDPESLKGYEERWTKIPQFAEIAFEYSIKSGRRFPEGEAGIAKSAEYAYLYARDVIKGRFPEGEAAIAKDAGYAYMYATDAIKRRFPEGEEEIAKSTHWAFFYARNVIKGRFPGGEAAIANSEWKQRYEREFKVKL